MLAEEGNTGLRCGETVMSAKAIGYQRVSATIWIATAQTK
jgi:hypothetical protein